MTTTPLMSLVKPDVSVTIGPTWATQLNVMFDIIDAHTHASGSGNRITPAGLNINSDLTFGNNYAIAMKAVRFQNLGANLAGASEVGQIYEVSGNLVFNNGSGVAVQITNGSGLNLASVGTIAGDYGGSNPASVSFSDTTATYSFTQDPGVTASMAFGPITIFRNSASSPGVTLQQSGSTVASFALTIPAALAASDALTVTDASGVQSFERLAAFSKALSITAAGTGLAVTNNATIGGTLGVTGATTLSSTLGVTGASTLAALAATTGTFSSTLGVTGLSTLGLTNIGGLTTAPQLTVATSGGSPTTVKLLGTVLGGTNYTSVDLYNGTATPRVISSGVGGLQFYSHNASISDYQTTVLTTNCGGYSPVGLWTLPALTVSGATILSSALAVSGASTLAGVSCTTLSASGAASLGSTLAVTGATSLASTLAVTGATTLSSTLKMGATSNGAGYDVSFERAGTFGLYLQAGSSGANSALVINNAANSLTLFRIAGDGAATVGGTLTAAATSVTTLSTSGAATLASLGVTGAATIGTTLGVSGSTTLVGLTTTAGATVGPVSGTGSSTIRGGGSSQLRIAANADGVTTTGLSELIFQDGASSKWDLYNQPSASHALKLDSTVNVLSVTQAGAWTFPVATTHVFGASGGAATTAVVVDSTSGQIRDLMIRQGGSTHFGMRVNASNAAFLLTNAVALNFSTDAGTTTHLSISTAGAATIGPSSGLDGSHLIRAQSTSQIPLIIDNSTAVSLVHMKSSSGTSRGYIGVDATDALKILNAAGASYLLTLANSTGVLTVPGGMVTGGTSGMKWKEFSGTLANGASATLSITGTVIGASGQDSAGYVIGATAAGTGINFGSGGSTSSVLIANSTGGSRTYNVVVFYI